MPDRKGIAVSLSKKTFDEGLSAYMNNEQEKARQLLTLSLQQDPENLEAANTLARIQPIQQERRQQNPLALQAVQAGIAAFSSGDAMGAEMAFRKALEIDPTSIEAQRSLDRMTMLKQGVR